MRLLIPIMLLSGCPATTHPEVFTDTLIPVPPPGIAPMSGDPVLRLILVGDTGMQGPMVKQVSAQVASEFSGTGKFPDRTKVVALGDLFYPHPPAGPGCVDAVVARYREYYGALPAGSVLAVAGNHDVYSEENPAGPDVLSPESVACTTAAFQRMGWLGAGAELANRTVALDGGGLTVDLMLVEGGLYSEAHPEIPGVRAGSGENPAGPDWQIVATHYLLSGSFGKGVDEIGKYFGVPEDQPFDVWVNGHAHQLEARMAVRAASGLEVGAGAGADPVLALISGTGAEMRTVRGFQQELWSVAQSFFVYGRCPSDPATCAADQAAGRLPPGLLPKEGDAGGYLRLDFSAAPARTLRVQPVVCTMAGCEDKPAVTCERLPDRRGVRCEAS